MRQEFHDFRKVAVENERLRAALEMARRRIVYYGTISDRRHFDHDLAEVYPTIDAALSNGHGDTP